MIENLLTDTKSFWFKTLLNQTNHSNIALVLDVNTSSSIQELVLEQQMSFVIADMDSVSNATKMHMFL